MFIEILILSLFYGKILKFNRLTWESQAGFIYVQFDAEET